MAGQWHRVCRVVQVESLDWRCAPECFALFNFHGDDRFAMPKVGIATRHSIAALRELILAVPCSARQAAHASLARW